MFFDPQEVTLVLTGAPHSPKEKTDLPSFPVLDGPQPTMQAFENASMHESTQDLVLWFQKFGFEILAPAPASCPGQ